MSRTVPLHKLVESLKNSGEYVIEDSNLLFQSDGTFVYLSDIDNEDVDYIEDDPTPDGLEEVIFEHHSQEYAAEICKELKGKGILFASFYCNDDFSY